MGYFERVRELAMAAAAPTAHEPPAVAPLEQEETRVAPSTAAGTPLGAPATTEPARYDRAAASAAIARPDHDPPPPADQLARTAPRSVPGADFHARPAPDVPAADAPVVAVPAAGVTRPPTEPPTVGRPPAASTPDPPTTPPPRRRHATAQYESQVTPARLVERVPGPAAPDGGAGIRPPGAVTERPPAESPAPRVAPPETAQPRSGTGVPDAPAERAREALHEVRRWTGEPAVARDMATPAAAAAPPMLGERAAAEASPSPPAIVEQRSELSIGTIQVTVEESQTPARSAAAGRG